MVLIFVLIMESGLATAEGGIIYRGGGWLE